jgi:predicted Zn-dependent protease with MMP-like domain
MNWERLTALALEEVEATVEELPEQLREKARALPVTLERRPNKALQEDGILPDTLGLFCGMDYASEEISSVPIPAQIILFLENIWEVAEEDEEFFAEEVHVTYLHELGHYLGLDEDDLFERGLE